LKLESDIQAFDSTAQPCKDDNWDDWEGEEEQEEMKCLFCSSKFYTASSVFSHCLDAHKFDFVKTRQQLGKFRSMREDSQIMSFPADHCSYRTGFLSVYKIDKLHS
jgi:hypothetical protein